MAGSLRMRSRRPDAVSGPFRILTIAAVLGIGADAAPAEDFQFSGHLNFSLAHARFPEDSLFHGVAGNSAEDFAFGTRLNLSWQPDEWEFAAQMQIAALASDAVRLSREPDAGLQAQLGRLPSDDRRLLNLTYVTPGQGSAAAVIRLDRLSAGYTGERGTIRLGRQAVTWGNGLVFNTVMDIFNPFDPTSVDREYKPGDDMLYGQYLRDSGDDIEFVAVLRRDPATGKVKLDQGSLAAKYHGFTDAGEYDLVVARHYGEHVFAIGGNRSVFGDALWRGDLSLTRTEDKQLVTSAVTSLSRSFVFGGKNVSGVAEYHFNGFGQGGGSYDLASLQPGANLGKRLSRGEVYNIGRHYLGLSALVELTPLLQVTPTAFVNVEDRSAFLQLSVRSDISEETLLQGSLNVPVGPSGTEFGGPESGVENRFLARGPSLFLQISHYF